MLVDPGYGFLAPQGNGRREDRTLLPQLQTSRCSKPPSVLRCEKHDVAA